ncbi:SDR family NAD(P)-dependent oxidoreductase [uncultured Sphingomonas sp.]|uniref:SDR family NAD(P)-dependent oxidoreductase n=1 Tax=uncultured Sphingomonas sp. TaxID=158754 RepID=UPI0035CA51EF
MFGAMTTADEVLQGVDLSGRRVLVTGASAGVGLETARVLVAHGAHVVGTARDCARLRAATAPWAEDRSTGSFRSVELDLASLASVRACADALSKAGEPFDVVIANAGVMAVPEGTTADGFETQFGTNHIGHAVLVNGIAGLLEPGGRVVMVSSAGHRGADVDLDDPNFERTAYDPLTAYRRSKTATILFAVEFDRRHRAAGVRATAVHPGAVLTDTTRKLIEAQPSAASAFAWKTVAQGAATSLWAGFVAPSDDIGGRYCEDCHVAEVNDDPAASSGVRSYALDPERASALWLKTEQMVGKPGIVAAALDETIAKGG